MNISFVVWSPPADSGGGIGIARFRDELANATVTRIRLPAGLMGHGAVPILSKSLAPRRLQDGVRGDLLDGRCPVETYAVSGKRKVSHRQVLFIGREGNFDDARDMAHEEAGLPPRRECPRETSLLLSCWLRRAT